MDFKKLNEHSRQALAQMSEHQGFTSMLELMDVQIERMVKDVLEERSSEKGETGELLYRKAALDGAKKLKNDLRSNIREMKKSAKE